MEKDSESYLELARKLCGDSKFFLALKAYERALDPLSTVVGSTLRDFILRCNSLSVSTIAQDVDVTKDYLWLCLDNMQRREWILGDLLGRGEVMVPTQENENIMFLISVTLNNWGCLLVRLGLLERAIDILRVALGAAISRELSRLILINICIAHLRNCCFPEARTAAMEVLDKVKEEEGEYLSEFSSDVENVGGDVDALLSALAYHGVAIADEYLTQNAVDGFYREAQEMLLGNPYQKWSSVFENNQRKFHSIVQRRREEAARRREIAEAEAAAVLQAEIPNRRKGKALRPTPPTGAAAAGKSMNRSKKVRKPTSSHQIDDGPVEFPPINSEIRWKIRTSGLSCSAVPIFSFHEVNHMFLGEKELSEEFESPIAFVGAAAPNAIAIVLVCERTPLQVADAAELEGDGPVRRTIWSLFVPRKADLTISLDNSKPYVRTVPASTEILKTFMPPPLNERAIENAKRGAAGLTKLLGQRLAQLLRAEAAYEERWKAAIIVKSALVAFNVAQDILKLKNSMKTASERQMALENSSARRIVRFFRMIREMRLQYQGPFYGHIHAQFRETAAATTLQTYTRRWLAVKVLRGLQAEHQAEVARVVTVQSVYRSQVVRRQYLESLDEKRHMLNKSKEMETHEFAAIQIQRAYRLHLQRLRNWCRRGEEKKALLHHYSGSRAYYAVLIQKIFRGYRVRRSYGPAVYTRRCYGRNIYRAMVLNVSATHIQRVFRGYLVRKTTREPLRQFMRQRAEERAELRQRYHFKAAVTIQSAYRAYKARQVAIQLREEREKQWLLQRKRVYVPFSLEEQVY